MNQPQIIPHKIFTLHELLQEISRQRLKSKTIAFTNGCF